MVKWEKYTKKYRKEWESDPLLKGWLIRNPDPADFSEARCKLCEVNLRPQKADLKKHAEKAKHKANVQKYNTKVQRRVDDAGPSGVGISVAGRSSKTIDLKLAMHIATHSPIRSIDHLGEVLKVVGKGSDLERLKMHRTKCSKLILKVIAPALLEAIVDDIKSSGLGYSLILDESTDISVVKYLAFVVRYFSQKHQDVVNEFLGIVEIERATAEDLFQATKTFLETIGLNYRDTIGIGSDGASNMVGKNHSLYVLFKREVPNLQLIKCVCHSLHLCASKASETLPADLEFLVRETRNWFAVSPQRRCLYQTLFKTINNGALPPKLVQLVRTRWLAFAPAIEVILKQWLELKTHFNTVADSPRDRCTIGRTLRSLYNDENTYLYLLFLKPITEEINKRNLSFQSSNAEVSKLFIDLKLSLLGYVRRIIKPVFIKFDSETYLNATEFQNLKGVLADDNAYLPLDCVDFGASFQIHLGRSKLPLQEVTGVKQRCLHYLSTLCREMANRFPDNIHLFEAVQHFVPADCLRPKPNQPDFFSLPLELAGPDADLDKMKAQWDNLPMMDWSREFGADLPASTKFWAEVAKIKDASGNSRYHDISGFALRVLSLPFSNAFVERVFSVMNSVKTKVRNRMTLQMLSSLLRIRLRFGTGGQCCHTFQPSDRMFELFNSTIYSCDRDDAVDGEDKSEEQDDILLNETFNLLSAADPDDPCVE